MPHTLSDISSDRSGFDESCAISYTRPYPDPSIFPQSCLARPYLKTFQMDIFVVIYHPKMSGLLCDGEISTQDQVEVSNWTFKRHEDSLVIDDQFILHKGDSWEGTSQVDRLNPWRSTKATLYLYDYGLIDCAIDETTKAATPYGPILVAMGTVEIEHQANHIGILILVVGVSLLAYSFRRGESKQEWSEIQGHPVG